MGNGLHRFQRDHFAGHFGKPFDPPQDVDKPGRVNFNHVAGVVPAGSQFGHRRFQHARPLDPIIAQHQIGAAHMQHAAAPDTCQRDHARFHAGQQVSHRTGMDVRQRINRQYRCHLGCAVAFQQLDTEFGPPDFTYRFGQFFCTGDDDTQAAEVFRGRVFGVVGKECAGTKQHAGAVLADQGGNLLVVQRRGIQKTRCAAEQRQQNAGSQAKRMKHRQRAEKSLVRRKINRGTDLIDVGQQRPVRQHHALGLAFRT